MNECDSMITFNLNKIKPYYKENTISSFNDVIESYYNYCDCNVFNDLRCPCCNRKGTLFFYKKYDRNFSYIENDTRIDSVISITVLECKYCKKCNNKQNKEKYNYL